MKENIREVAVALIKNEGITFKLDDIAKELKISKKTIYKYYTGKEDIIKEIIDLAQQDIYMQERLIVESDRSTLDKIRDKLLIVPIYSELYTNHVLLGLQKHYPGLYFYISKLFKEGWDRTFYLFEKAVEEDIFIAFDFQLFKTMYVAGVTSIHSEDKAYHQRLSEVINILIEGVKKHKREECK